MEGGGPEGMQSSLFVLFNFQFKNQRLSLREFSGMKSLALILLCMLAVGCSSPQVNETGEPVLVELVVQSADSAALKLSPEACRASLEESLAQKREWRVVQTQSPGTQTGKAKRVRVVLSEPSIELVAKDGTGKRLASWFFLGPAHFWLRDHTFRLTYTPSFTVRDASGVLIGQKQNMDKLSVTRRLNFHEWSGRVTWYILSNLVPPFWSDPDPEELTASLFKESSGALTRSIDKGLRGELGKLPSASRFRFLKTSGDSESPLKLLKPKPGQILTGPKIEVEFAVIDSSALTSVSDASQEYKAPFTTPMTGSLIIKNAKAELNYRDKTGAEGRLTLLLEPLNSSVQKKVKGKDKESGQAKPTLEIRRIVPELSSPIRILKPKEGDPVVNDRIDVEVEIVAPKLLSAIKIGPQSWSAPFQRKRLKGTVKLIDGRGTLTLISLDQELSRVRFLCRAKK